MGGWAVCRVRLERRRLWLAAVTVQKEFRKQRHRK